MSCVGTPGPLPVVVLQGGVHVSVCGLGFHEFQGLNLTECMHSMNPGLLNYLPGLSLPF